MKIESREAKPSRVAGVFISLLALSIGMIPLCAEVKVLGVDPHQTDPAITLVQGPHVAVYDPLAIRRHRLVLFLIGTRAKPAGSLAIDKSFAELGFHAISLDYENNLMAASYAHDRDPSAFGRYRQAIVTGASVTPDVQTNPANSILNRFQTVLAYLVKNDPNGGWDEFLNHDQPVWSHIIVAGHSQGAGHAAYIGQMFRVDKVLMFSGPQDYMDDLNQPAPWQGRKSATPPARFFAFLNLKDPFNEQHQVANCVVLMHMSKPDTLMVKPGDEIQGEHHILVNDFPTEQHHGSTLFPQFENVWKYLVTIDEE